MRPTASTTRVAGLSRGASGGGRRWPPLWGEGYRGAPVSDVQRQLESETRQPIQQEVPLRTHMGLDERRQRPEGFDGQPCGPGGLAEHPWQPPGMDRDQGGWEQLQRAQGSCLLLAPLRCDLPACAKEDASIRARPLRDAVAPFVKLPAEVAQPQRAAENAGPARCAPFPAGGGGGRRHMVPCEAASHGLGGRRAQPYCRTVCAHVGIRGREAGPGDGASPERLEGGRGLGGASCQFFAPRSGASIGAEIAVKRTPARRYTPL